MRSANASREPEDNACRTRALPWRLLPVVRSEWSRRQSGCVEQPRIGRIPPCVTHGNGIRNVVRTDDNVISIDARLSREEFPILPGYLERHAAIRLCRLQPQSLGVRKRHPHPRLLAFSLREHGPVRLNLFPEQLVTRMQREPAADILFVLRMNILRITDIDRHRHTGLRQRERLRLRFTQVRPVVSFAPAATLEIRELHEIKRQRLAEVRAPLLDQAREERSVFRMT